MRFSLFSFGQICNIYHFAKRILTSDWIDFELLEIDHGTWIWTKNLYSAQRSTFQLYVTQIKFWGKSIDECWEQEELVALTSNFQFISHPACNRYLLFQFVPRQCWIKIRRSKVREELFTSHLSNKIVIDALHTSRQDHLLPDHVTKCLACTCELSPFEYKSILWDDWWKTRKIYTKIALLAINSLCLTLKWKHLTIWGEIRWIFLCTGSSVGTRDKGPVVNKLCTGNPPFHRVTIVAGVKNWIS